jgi:hypothetical protein
MVYGEGTVGAVPENLTYLHTLHMEYRLLYALA